MQVHALPGEILDGAAVLDRLEHGQGRPGKLLDICEEQHPRPPLRARDSPVTSSKYFPGRVSSTRRRERLQMPAAASLFGSSQ